VYIVIVLLSPKMSQDIDGVVSKHHVHQMQYLSWPDHGVPDDSSDFLEFISRVRDHRNGVVEPVVVHCRYLEKKSAEL